MVNQQLAGWILVAVGILLLAAFNRLDLIAILLPASAVVGYGITRPSRKSRLTRGRGKG
jgi:hypothetical protein